MTRKLAWFGALSMAAAIGAAVTVASVIQYTDGARPGAAFPDITAFGNARKAEVKLPIGTLEVKIGKPSQEYDTDFDETTRAADGASFVPVGWGITGAEVGLSNAVPIYQFGLTLVADGRRYDLQAGREEKAQVDAMPIVSSGSVAAVVEGGGENLELEVEYDGVTQVLDVDSGRIDSGPAEPYYAKGGLPSLSTGGCTSLSAVDKQRFTALLDKCSLGPVTLVPYVGGLGWVRSKTESWVVARYSLQVGTVLARGGNGSYSTRLRRFDITLNGAAATADIRRYRDEYSLIASGYKIFRVSGRPKNVRVVTEVSGDSRFNGSGTRIFRNDQTLPLR